MNLKEAWKPVQHADGRSRLLRRVLLVNAAFSGATGAGLAALGPMFDAALGLPTLLPARPIGLALIPFALWVTWVATRPDVRTQALLVIALDLAWVAGSGVLVLSASTLTTLGVLATLITSAAVLAFALGQLHGIRRLEPA